jgi:hypothetical protein
MKKFLFTVFITLNIFFSFGQSYKLTIPIKIEVYDTYTVRELAQKTIDIDKKMAILEDSMQKYDWRKHPLLSILQLNLDNENRPSHSSYIGLSESHDTSKVSNYFNQSLLMPEGVSYEWSYLQKNIYKLVVHKKNNKRLLFSNSDIKTFIVEKTGKTSDVEIGNFDYFDSDYLIRIKLNKESIEKIKKEMGEILYIKISLSDRLFILSLPFEKLKKEVLIKDSIYKDFINSLK